MVLSKESSQKKDKKRFSELSKRILKHRELYHGLDNSEISDEKYDQFVKEYLELQEKWPDLQKESSLAVGHKPLSQFTKVKHAQPMLSLQNSFSEEDIIRFDTQIEKRLSKSISYFCEPKLDGLAIEIIYKDGVYVRALTRGDGVTGEDVTKNVAEIESLPKKLKTRNPPSLLEIRGEIVILKKDFEKLNTNQKKNKNKIFSNARQAAAGSIRQLDAKIIKERFLKVFAYSHGAIDGLQITSQDEFIKTLEGFGIPTINIFKKHKGLLKICKNHQEVMDHFKKIKLLRDELEYEIDGTVIKVNDFKDRRVLGDIARSPRWATAIKLVPEQAETQIKNIIIQVGRTGALTPVAIMTPVNIGGTLVSQATLHNQNEINRKDVRIGDTVIIQRAGDVIPEIVEVNQSKRKSNAKKFKLPKKCPVCQTPAKQEENEMVSRCPNSSCKARIKKNFIHFVSRRAMNIEKLGASITEDLLDKELIKNFSDIYKLKKENLLQLNRQGDKSTENILKSIEASRYCSLSTFIYSLGIRFVGEQTAKDLAHHFKDINTFLKTTEKELLEVKGFGPKVVESILQSTHNKNFKYEVKRLNSELKIQASSQKKHRGLDGIQFVITGTLSVPRSQARQFIEDHGGKVVATVTKETNFLITEEPEATSSKAKQAQKNKVPIISWENTVKRANA